jgi:hypothetical protein
MTCEPWKSKASHSFEHTYLHGSHTRSDTHAHAWSQIVSSLEKTQIIGNYSLTVISTVLSKYISENKMFCKFKWWCLKTKRWRRCQSQKGAGITQDWRKLKIEKFHKACSSPMLLGTKSERIRWQRHAESMDKVINLYRNAFVKPVQRGDKRRILLNKRAWIVRVMRKSVFRATLNTVAKLSVL